MTRGGLSRRGVLRGAGAVVLAAPALGMLRPDTLPSRKAVFEEVGNSVLMTLALPTLFRRTDRDALASIDSGFDTTLEFHLDVWEHGTRRHVADRVVVRKIRRDPWKQQYVVRTQGSSGWIARAFDEQQEAIDAACELDRVRVVAASDLVRGGEEGPFYFVSVLALRNPLQDVDAGTRRRRDSSRRDLEWFGRLVDALAGEAARAEEIVHVRTNPFYLVPR